MVPSEGSDAPLFIDGDVHVFRGDEAARLLEAKNDARFLDGARGVVSVDLARWQEAQAYERRTWMDRAVGAFDDRNHDHEAAFDGYSALRDRTFRRGIELGCGPFTNMRLLLEIARIREVHLLDPLAHEYLRHPFCRYKGNRIGGIRSMVSAAALPAWRSPRGPLRELGNALRIGGVLGRPVHVVNSSIEDFHDASRFDLVVMLNVLEHCRDAAAVFARVGQLLEPGGLFVFHDRTWPEDELRRTITRLYDAGHPIRPGHVVVEEALASYEPVLRKDLPIVDREDGIEIHRTAVYFIGRKPRS